MKVALYNRDVDVLQRNLKLSIAANLGLVASVVLLAILLLANIGRERTLVVPAGLKQSFWLTDTTMSGTGLEELSGWLASLKLEVSPTSVGWKNEMTLLHTHPSQHGVMKSEQIVEAAKIKGDNISTTFSVMGWKANEDKLAGVISGVLTTYVNGLKVRDGIEHYFMRYAMSGGKAQLLVFKKVDHVDIGRLISENAPK